MSTRARAVVVTLAPLLLSGCLYPEVVRVVDGRQHRGDFVFPEAYAAYARAAIAEREGRLLDAARDYAVAADASDDPAVHARLGATLCALRREEAARQAFEAGLERDGEAAVVFRERARCALARGALAEATTSAERAMQLDPWDREGLVILHAALARVGRTEEADALAAEAAARGAPIGRSSPPSATPSTPSSAPRTLPGAVAAPGRDVVPLLRISRPDRAAVDAALARGDLPAALRTATAAGISRAELAARALAHGHRDWASGVARRVFAADPGSATAWCVAAAGADDDHLRERLGALPSAAPSPLASLLYAELLLRRGGPDAALAWIAPAALDRPREDPLEELIRARLRAALPAP